ncbi:MAG: tol-pal system protein YbgF [Alphaproteobacteria bacterium]
MTSFEAFAQNRDTNNRLSRIENELETLSRAIYRGEQPPPGAFSGSGDTNTQARNEIRIQELETQVRNLNGRLEEQNFQIRQLTDSLERLSADIDIRFGEIQTQSGVGFGNVAPSSGTESRVTNSGANAPLTASSSQQQQSQSGGVLGTITERVQSDIPAGVPTNDSAAALYENAFSLLQSGNYAGAERDFEAFLRDHENHALAANAKYWLGETFYVRGDFERAARVFAEGYQKYPNGSKATDNLLKLGLSLASSGNATDACVALRQLQRDNPNGVGPVMRRAEQEIARLGC